MRPGDGGNFSAARVTGMNRAVIPAAGAALVLLLTGCSTDTTTESEATPTATATATPTPTPKATRTPPPDRDGDGVMDIRDDFPDDPARSVQLRYPSGDPVVEGYPLVVDTAQLDYRVANWIKTPQVVAVAPGVYVGYSSAVPDLSNYLTAAGAAGDCVVLDAFGLVGTCWNGVPPSPAEPAQ